MARGVAFIILTIFVSLLLGSGHGQAPEVVDILGEIRSRGFLRCGINTDSGFFGAVEGLNGPAGYDIDYCDAIAVALFGSEEEVIKVSYISVEIYERFSSLRNQTVDVVIRTVTNTLGRDTVENVTFTNPNFYDGQGFMVPDTSPITTIEELDQPGNTYCVTIATTTVVNAQSYFQYAQAILFDDNPSRNNAYYAGNCTAVTTDVTTLVTFKRSVDRILPGVISREPLSLVIWEVDPNWTAFVQWVVQGISAAQYYGLARSNVATVIDFTDLPLEARRLLGLEPLNLTFVEPDPSWMAWVLTLLGNYQDLYSRQIGAEVSQHGSFNNIYTQGGLNYPLVWAPPTEPPYNLLPWSGSLVDIIRARGYLNCGCHQNSPLFGAPDTSTFTDGGGFPNYNGFDADFCKAIAAAIFAGVDESVGPTTLNLRKYLQFVPIVNNRLQPLSTLDIDVLVYQTTATIGRDIANRVSFTDPILFDGQSFLVRTADHFASVESLNLPSVYYCAPVATTTAQNAASALPLARARLYDSLEDAAAAFANNECDALTSDESALLQFATPDTEVLPTMISREPLAIVVSDYDVKFYEIAQWVRHGLLLADFYNITQSFIFNLADPLVQQTPALLALNSEAQRLLGVAGVNNTGLPLDPMFMRYVVAAVGNYNEIYSRSIGTVLPRANSQNSLWTVTNGLMYAPPWTGQSSIAKPPAGTAPTSAASQLMPALALILLSCSCFLYSFNFF